jgi:hypothetical protein
MHECGAFFMWKTQTPEGELPGTDQSQDACCIFMPTNVTTIIIAPITAAIAANFPAPRGGGVG